MFLNTSKKKIKKRIFFIFIKYIFYLVIIAALLLFFLLILNFVNIKNVYEKALSGKKNLEYTISLMREGDFDSALDFNSVSQENFKEALDYVEKIKKNIVINNLSYLSQQIEDVHSLLSTAYLLSESLDEGIKFSMSLNDIIGPETNFNNLSSFKKEELIKKIYESGPELNGLKANLDLALLNIDNINYQGFIKFFKNKIEDLRIQIQSVNQTMKSAVPMSELLPFVLGYPEKSSFLVVLQNRDELRPTGGFIGTYGILEIEHGDILRFDTHDVYHLDMPVKDRINVEPPKPLKDYLGIEKWYMRDANWSPDWPESAKQIEWFFKEEDKLLPPKDQINNFKDEFDGFIAITPDLIIDLLKIIGPIIIEGEEYNQNNFVDLLQYEVEKGYEVLGVPSWHRKEVIGEIAKEIKFRIFDFQTQNFYKLIDTLDANLKRKNILIYFKDENLSEIVYESGWDGSLSEVEGDYLMVVDANMAAFKTDRVIDRKISYQINEGSNGIFSDLNIIYKHNGEFDWKTTRYRTYTRIYVPLGSELISAEGFFQDKEPEIYEDLNKTVFAGFISIEPGEIANIHLHYKLSETIDLLLQKDYYSFYIQKQPGKNIQEINIGFNFNKNINTYYPTGFYAEKYGRQINWDTDFLMDREFIVNF